MNDQIICPNCKKPIPLTQALSHQLQEKYTKQFSEERSRLIVLYQKRINEEKQKIEKESIEKAREKIQQEMELKFTDTKNENEEMKKQLKDLQKQFLETNKLTRQLRNEKSQMKIELEKKLAQEEEKIRIEERQKAYQEHHFKDLEKDKKLQDVLKINEELKRKVEQGSQQAQGEVLELELEKLLKTEFPLDEILPIAKGKRGADIIQTIKNHYGQICGKIIWEAKRAQSWDNKWVVKLKDDQREAKAEIAVLIANILPQNIKNFGFKNGIWISDYGSILGLATALRINLIDLMIIKLVHIGKNEKLEVLHQYITGTEFKQRIEAIIEAFTTLQDEIEREKRWFAAKWARQEKSIRKVIDHTLGMHGDLQSIMGKSLADIKGLGMLPTQVT